MRGVAKETSDFFNDKTHTCNHLMAALHSLSSIGYLQSVAKRQYLASIESINRNERTYLPLFVHQLFRTMYHLSQGSLTEKCIVDLQMSAVHHLPIVSNYAFTRYSIFLNELLLSLHQYTKYVRHDPRDTERHQSDLALGDKL